VINVGRFSAEFCGMSCLDRYWRVLAFHSNGQQNYRLVSKINKKSELDSQSCSFRFAWLYYKRWKLVVEYLRAE
jgi:hypothetical protein